MFNPSSLPFVINPGLSHSSGSQQSSASTFSAAETLLEQAAGNGVAATQQSYSLSERFSRDDSFTLSLTTQDGDQVEITFNSETRYQSDYAQRSSQGQQEQRYSIDKAQSSEFGFSVAGELDVDELDAIANLVQDLSSLAANFFNGDLQTAMQQAGDLSFDATQLAQMDLSMQQSMEYRAVEQYRSVQSIGEPSAAVTENGLIPFVEQLQGLVSRSETYIESASSVSMKLLVTLVEHDLRFTSASDAEQSNMKESLTQLSDRVHNGHHGDHQASGEREQKTEQDELKHEHKHDAHEAGRARHEGAQSIDSDQAAVEPTVIIA
ncbi:MAG: hypothetical protein QNK43_09275 [Amphritea sp.]|nr:hypothetical protein [Amphritea sp.]